MPELILLSSVEGVMTRLEEKIRMYNSKRNQMIAMRKSQAEIRRLQRFAGEIAKQPDEDELIAKAGEGLDLKRPDGSPL